MSKNKESWYNDKESEVIDMARKKNTNSENQFLRSIDGMAYGLFCSEVIGYCITWLGNWLNYSQFASWGNIITGLSGSAVGIGVAYATGARGIALISAALAGAICQGSGVAWVICAYAAVMISVYVGEFLRNKTPIDIFLTPVLTIATACLISSFVAPYLNMAVSWLVSQISVATAFSPLIMGMFVALLMSILSVTPLSMVTICSLAGLGGLSSGAALAGTCGTMIGLAMMSMDDNEIGDVIAVAIGTPVLQFKNCLKNPLILVPIMIAALVTGPISTCLFKITTTHYGAGMACRMFEGPLSVISTMGSSAWLPMLITDILLPILISYSIYRAFRKLGWIKGGDLKVYRL